MGFVPSFFIMNTIGAGLNSYVEKSQTFNIFDLLFTPEILYPILMFGGLMIISLFIKSKFFNDTN